MLRLPAVLSTAVRAALLIDMMMIVIVLGANLTSHLTMPHLNAAVSSCMKTFPAISTVSSWSSASVSLGFDTRHPRRALVSTADIAINDAKENAWMALYEHDRDTLEDILYRCLQDLWAPLTYTTKVFDTHGSAQQLCADCSARPRNRPHDTLGWRLQGM
jgi:hypothetical protein